MALVAGALIVMLTAADPALGRRTVADTAGPLTVRLEAPERVTQTARAETLVVTLYNSGEATLQGTVEVPGFGRWEVAPNSPTPFSLAAGDTARLEFAVRALALSHVPFYRLAALAQFEWQGQRQRVRPTLTLPGPAVASAGPLTVKLEGPEQVTQAARPEAFTVSLESGVDTALGGTLRVHGIGAWQVSPDGPVPFALEGRGSVRLTFAVQPAATSYNAFYPVHATAAFPWQGQTHEAHAVLVVPVDRPDPPRPRLPAGPQPLPETPPDSVSAPPAPVVPPRGSSRLLGTIAGYEVRLWPGQRGLLDATVGFVEGERALYFRGFEVRVLGQALEDPGSPHAWLRVHEEPAADRYRLRHDLGTSAGDLALLTESWIEGGALRTRFWMEGVVPQPWVHPHIEDVAVGPWSEPAVRVYAGPGNVMQDPGAFRLKANGHYLATSYVGVDFAGGISLVQGVDVPVDHLRVDPEARHCSLHTPHAQVVSLIPTRHVWAAALTFRELCAPRAAGGVPRLAGRFVFDLWGGRYAEAAAALRRAFRYGTTDAVVIWHRWQRWGYDYRLPDIYPPNAEWGTFDEFVELVAACRDHGALFAPHDNYMDFYPDSEGFTYDNIAFTADGGPQTAWFNRGANAQSYHPRSDRVLPFLQRNLRLIRDGFAPGAYFIDVWSSEPPYDYYTAEGQFFDRVYTRDVWREGFAWGRDCLGGAPQLSEAGHDQYIGWLDGGTAAQMRAEAGPERSNVWQIETSDTERVPWFDIAYHDVFALHGAGYTARYASGQDARAHGIYSDDYITTEVMTGHPGMVSEAFGRDPVRKYWLLHDLMRGLALRRMAGFAFAGGDLHRHEIHWDNGGTVWVNRGAADWNAAGHELPQYGFYARVPGGDGVVEAAIERRDSLIVEWSRSPGMLYVNARPVVFDEPPARSSGWGSGRDAGPDPRPARMNPDGRLVTVGALSTNGAFRLVRAAEGLELTPLPSSPGFAVRIRWRGLPWTVDEPRQAEAVDEEGRVAKTVPLTRRDGKIELACEPGVFAYRLR
ncbi:MAG: hypothetical protein AB1505_20835 [Candidatus Latescibacterota bacterium]